MSSKILILHYSAPPVIGGVEAVILAHIKQFNQAGYHTIVVAGRGDKASLPDGTEFIEIPEIDSLNPGIQELNQQLEKGILLREFDSLVIRIVDQLRQPLKECDNVIVHNILTKHFNLPLTAAICQFLDEGVIRNGIAWCHDFTWTSPHSRSKVHPGYPWDLLRTYREDLTYVVVSKERQQGLADLFNCGMESINVIYNGVDVQEMLGLSREGSELVYRLGMFESDLNILMPVRVTNAKNIEYAFEVLSALKAYGKSPKLVLTGPPDPHDSHSMKYYQSLIDNRKRMDLESEMHFVYEFGSDINHPRMIDNREVGDLYRVSDVIFMPSHREGFGMPVLEAGLAGVPVMSSEIPAAKEIALKDCLIFDISQEPGKTANMLIDLIEENPISRLRITVRKEYTWKAIFERKIAPLLV